MIEWIQICYGGGDIFLLVMVFINGLVLGACAMRMYRGR